MVEVCRVLVLEENQVESAETRGIGEHVDLDDLVREQILLALPTRQLCRDDCKGLCPTCGANLNQTTCDCSAEEIDPRFAALAQLLAEEETAERMSKN